ncbi:two-component system sensor histidine kinase NtrB [Taibaiella koreensis]|uniref:two-component system sensor histidine kinase NtrB n=1 Tax=Taibaiella koreensis TaxID=1268548 RepID=UPI000E59BC99|nr:ATP-binding protein [Taibaiella koreensis]
MKDKPVIRISDASNNQLLQLKNWLNEDYTISTDTAESANLSISYTTELTSGIHTPFIRFESVNTGDLRSTSLSYQLPAHHVTPSIIKVIVGLLLHSGKEALDSKNYRMAFDRAHDLILLADCEHNILRANQSAIDILGFSEAELKGMNLASLFYSAAAGEDFISNICEKGRIVHWDYRLRTKTGLPVDVMMSADMMNEEDKIFLCIAQNISVHKEAGRQRKQEEHLVIMGKMAQMIAHEVRNPLNNILLAVSQLKTDPKPPPEAEKMFLDIIDRNCLRINALVTEMLEPSRLLDMELEPVSLRTIVEEALYLNEDRIGLQGIKVTLDLQQDRPLMIDKEKMIICVSNILVNATEAIDGDKGRITIKTRQHGDRILLCITDNGKGMTENEKNNIFNPYFTTKPRGTGMGMAATQQIVRAHNGTIEVISEKGKGSEIILSLPLPQQQ